TCWSPRPSCKLCPWILCRACTSARWFPAAAFPEHRKRPLSPERLPAASSPPPGAPQRKERAFQYALRPPQFGKTRFLGSEQHGYAVATSAGTAGIVRWLQPKEILSNENRKIQISISSPTEVVITAGIFLFRPPAGKRRIVARRS